MWKKKKNKIWRIMNDEMQLNLIPTYPQTLQNACILNNNQTAEIKELKQVWCKRSTKAKNKWGKPLARPIKKENRKTQTKGNKTTDVRENRKRALLTTLGPKILKLDGKFAEKYNILKSDS